MHEKVKISERHQIYNAYYTKQYFFEMWQLWYLVTWLFQVLCMPHLKCICY